MVREKKNKLLIFGLLATAVIGIIALSPSIYAIVEPHITINMDPGQTTKPFIINDTATNTEIFSVDADGSTKLGNIVNLNFGQQGVIQVPSTASGSNPDTLAVWQIVKDPSVSDNYIVFVESTVIGNIRQVSGGGETAFGLFRSTDGITWQSVQVAPGSAGTFQAEFGNLTFHEPVLGAQFIAVGVYTTSSSGVGEVKDISVTSAIDLPTGYSLERIS